MEPIVDILMPVYNHAKYLAMALDGVLMQQTTYKYRIIVGEDCSTDNSREILRQYAAQHPDVILPVYHEKNLGATGNGAVLYSLITAKYLALCEGDDYWTDPHKLQKQLDFLEAHPDFSICFSDVEVIDELDKELRDTYPPLYKDEFSMEDIVTAGYCFIPTATLVYRNCLPSPMPDFYLNAASGDIAIHLLLADKGKAKRLPEKTAVYRHHAGGLTKTEEHRLRGDDKEFILYVEANKFFNYKYDPIFRKRLLAMAKVKLVYGSRNIKGFKKLRHVLKSAPAYFKYSDGINVKEAMYYFTLLFFPSLLKLKQ